jgi:hypothetical protein
MLFLILQSMGVMNDLFFVVFSGTLEFGMFNGGWDCFSNYRFFFGCSEWMAKRLGGWAPVAPFVVGIAVYLWELRKKNKRKRQIKDYLGNPVLFGIITGLVLVLIGAILEGNLILAFIPTGLIILATVARFKYK